MQPSNFPSSTCQMFSISTFRLVWPATRENDLLFVLFALLLLTAAATADRASILGLMHLESCPALIGVIFETLEVWLGKLIVLLGLVSVAFRRRCDPTNLLLELLVNGIECILDGYTF